MVSKPRPALVSWFVSFADSISIGHHLYVAFLVRVVLVMYGSLVHDQAFKVKYTDIDYVVFTDGARYMNQGRSPLLRDGYRYTPLMAGLLIPNLYLFEAFGKLLFALFDVLTGYLIYKILREPALSRAKSYVNKRTANLSACLWLYNPLPIIVSTRGSSDSIITFLVLAVISLLVKKKYSASGLIFGLVVHCKLYPVIYVPACYLYLSQAKRPSLLSFQMWFPLTRTRLQFFVSAFASFVFFTYACYLKYGDLYLREAWIYHFNRKDVQHNFSPYFYIYHFVPEENHQLISYMAFVPQAISIIGLSVHLMVTKRKESNAIPNFLFAIFCQTFLFVSLNKVCTSQYFLWYLCLFPLIVPFLPRMTGRHALQVLIWWLLGQAQWLLPAYLYEFRKWNCLLWVWTSSLFFLCINFTLLAFTFSHYDLNKRK